MIYSYGSSNSKNISLLSMVGKVYERLLIEKIRNMKNNVLFVVKCNFRRGIIFLDHIFLVH